MTNSKLSTKNFILLILLAYIFSLSVRTIWVYQFNGVEEFRWNNQLMINTNDGYGYAEGARDILSGTHQKGDGSFIDTSLAIVTAFFAKVLPFSFETIILWMPTFLGSLLVIPIMLMARALNQEYAGFIGALLGGIAWSYYNRTMTGYYDTDMLTIVLPALTLWAVIFAMIKEKNRYILLVALFMVLSNLWYFHNYSLSLSMAGMVLVYTLIFDRKNLFNYKILIFMLIALSQIALLIKLPILLALFGLFHTKKNLEDKVIYSILALSILIILITGGLDPIISRVNGYLFRDSADTVGQTGLHYFSVVKTVREAGQIPFETFANRISGDTTIFILSIIGYLLLIFKNRIFLLSLPMVGLGFIALWGGLRFTVYAVPILALGMGYHIIYISNFIKEKKAKLAFVSIATIAILIPNILHIEGYKVPTVFNKQAVEVLDKLKNIASREDYVLAWWDYGYPIRYYAKLNTLVDGGKHSGDVNWPVSFALTRSLLPSYNTSILDVYFTKQGKNDFVKALMQKYNVKLDEVEEFLSKKISLPKIKEDIYYYLPYRMLNIFPTVAIFSSINLKTGKTKNHFFYSSSRITQRGNILNIGSMNIDLFKKLIIIGNRGIPIKRIALTYYDKKGELHTSIQKLNNIGLNVVFMKSYARVLVMDDFFYNSAYIQLFVFEKKNKFFKPVILTPIVKVYKVVK